MPVDTREGDRGEVQAEYVRLARDGAFNYGGQLAAALIGFAIVPLLLHRLGAEAYGVLIVAISCAAVAGFLDLGLGTSMTREVAASSAGTEHFLASGSGALALFGAVGALVLAALGSISQALGLAPGIGETPLVFAFVGLAFFADQVVLYHTAVLGGLRRFDLVNGLLVGSVASRAAGTAALLLAGAGVAAVAAWYAASAWLWALLNALAVRQTSPSYAFRPTLPNAAALRSRLGFGAGSTTIMAALGSIWNAGPLVVAGVNGAGASALYQVSQRFPLAVMALPDRVSVTLFPAASEQAPRGGGSGAAARLIGSGTRLIAVVLLPLAIVMLVTADDLLDAWLGSVPPDGALILRLTMLAVVAQGLSASALQVLWGLGQVRQLSTGLVITAIMSVVGAVAFDFAFGPWGAALALAVAATLAAVGVLALAARFTRTAAAELVGPAAAGLAWPTLACAGVTIALTALGVGEGWLGLALVGLAGTAAYVIAFGLLGRGSLEQEIVGSLTGSLRRHERLRSAAYLAIELRDAAADTPRRRRSASLAAYEQRSDPWGYGSEWGPRHLELTERLLTLAASEGRDRRALDLGCGEGWATELLIPRYREVLAVDISEVALERARLRCGDASHVRFERWDIFEGDSLGEFDLVLAMGVLEVFRRPRALQRARLRVMEALAPGGFLLVTTTKQNPLVENARWSAALVRGSRGIDRFLRASGRLERRAQEESDTHALTLYRLADSSR
jgi:O-antigen/teichoic acid export membrane protein/SAM-dependent methyltransferase